MATAKRTFPTKTIEQALRVPRALRENNGGNPWATPEVAKALGIGKGTANFFYLTAASRDYGFTTGTRETTHIALTELGRRAVYPQSGEEQQKANLEGFLKVDVFAKVLKHYGGNNLPEPQYLANTLQQEYGVDPKFHGEFVDIFTKNCKFLGIGSTFDAGSAPHRTSSAAPSGEPPEVVTVAVPDDAENAPVLFVIMPFTEREEGHETGFFGEVLDEIFKPAGTAAGFKVQTANRMGTDVIQSTIINELLEADLVLADLTEHNPNVLFELGMRMREDKPVALVRARGTGQIFDVDTTLRVQEYDPNLWTSTVKKDIPAVQAHIEATWDNKETAQTFMKILRRNVPQS